MPHFGYPSNLRRLNFRKIFYDILTSWYHRCILKLIQVILEVDGSCRASVKSLVKDHLAFSF